MGMAKTDPFRAFPGSPLPALEPAPGAAHPAATAHGGAARHHALGAAEREGHRRAPRRTPARRHTRTRIPRGEKFQFPEENQLFSQILANFATISNKPSGNKPSGNKPSKEWEQAK